MFIDFIFRAMPFYIKTQIFFFKNSNNNIQQNATRTKELYSIYKDIVQIFFLKFLNDRLTHLVQNRLRNKKNMASLSDFYALNFNLHDALYRKSRSFISSKMLFSAKKPD